MILTNRYSYWCNLQHIELLFYMNTVTRTIFKITLSWQCKIISSYSKGYIAHLTNKSNFAPNIYRCNKFQNNKYNYAIQYINFTSIHSNRNIIDLNWAFLYHLPLKEGNDHLKKKQKKLQFLHLKKPYCYIAMAK